MTGGAKQLHGSGSSVHAMGAHVADHANKAVDGCDEAVLTAAIHRFSAAWSRVLTDTGTQILAASQLAANAAQDLTAATGGSGHS